MGERSSFPAGKRITFTGRLASMSRAAALRVVTDHGGLVRDRVTRRTDVLVIGADGWPLRKSGSITHNLQRANQLQEAGGGISIIGEAEFLRQICGSDEVRPIRRQHTLEQLSRLLGVSGLRLRRWIDLGLIRSTDSGAIAPTFDYQEVTAAKTLSRLIARGVAPSKLAHSLRLLQRWLPEEHGLGGSIVALENQLLVRDGGELIGPSGQLHFSFDEPPERSHGKLTTTFGLSEDADQLFDRAYRDDLDGRTERAIKGYTDWLDRFGEDHEVLFNLANAYFQQELLDQAITHYRRCLRTHPKYAPAWNNLGLCLYQSHDLAAAIESLRRSVDLDPDNVDTMFNLADMLDEAGSDSEARLLWMRIARHPGESVISDYAKQQLDEHSEEVGFQSPTRDRETTVEP